ASSDEAPESYFGFIDDDEDRDSRYGKVQQFMLYKEPISEQDLLLPFETVQPLQSLFLKPDRVPALKKNIFSSLLRRDS
ncbi:hypothetical protein ACWKSR_13035, partial [Campylobacter fetus subsp. venerealis]